MSTITTPEQESKRFGLIDSLASEPWLKLPYAVMRDVGPAVQTLGGLLRLSDKETFCSVEKIARKVILPVPTVRKHLATLSEKGWITHSGRGRSKAGRPRRTVTYRITDRTRSLLEPYGVLPWWASANIRTLKRMRWGARAVLSVVMSRLISLAAVVERQSGQGDLDAGDVFGSIDNLGGDERFQFSLSWLTETTGLNHETVYEAKRQLASLRIIKWFGGVDLVGAANRHRLMPNEDFQVVITPAKPGFVFVDFAW